MSFLRWTTSRGTLHDAVSHRATLAALTTLAALAAGAVTSCRTTPASEGDGARAAQDTPDPHMPAWLGAPPHLVRDPQLEEAATLLCARDTDGVLDEDARHAAGLLDGQIFGLLRKAASASDAQSALATDAGLLLLSSRASHAGAITGPSPSGGTCGALVYTRRLLFVQHPPAARLPTGGILDVELRVPAGKKATLYAAKPDGFVARWALPSGRETAGAMQKVSVPPMSGDGRYVLEVLLDVEDGPSDPEVALLWPWNVGAPREAPFPEVLFPDKGHGDLALTHRAEALVQRLRNEQLIEPLKVSPPLVDVALARAQAVAARGSLGHRIVVRPEQHRARDPREQLRDLFGEQPRAQFLRLAEVQGQGSTLADAWQALLDSPAHRYELTDTAFTHVGVAVARGRDAAGRATVNLIALLARRPPNRDPDATRAIFLATANAAREKRGLDPLWESSHLNRTAARLAGAMRDQRSLDDTLLGGPIAQLAIEADASLRRVQPLVARSDDPLLLLNDGVPSLLMALDATQAGVGIALEPQEGAFYIVVLAGE